MNLHSPNKEVFAGGIRVLMFDLLYKLAENEAAGGGAKFETLRPEYKSTLKTTEENKASLVHLYLTYQAAGASLAALPFDNCDIEIVACGGLNSEWVDEVTGDPGQAGGGGGQTDPCCECDVVANIHVEAEGEVSVNAEILADCDPTPTVNITTSTTDNDGDNGSSSDPN